MDGSSPAPPGPVKHRLAVEGSGQQGTQSPREHIGATWTTPSGDSEVAVDN